ncbi:MAG: hypothetical protein LBS11_05025 [Oscillospiraceae bacterium]|jgi:hypothetical protein|nr:hypothetical protein [Oscillospiraceae bacterium]
MAELPVLDNTYITLRNALTTAGDGDTVRLTQDITDFTGYGPIQLTATGVTLEGDDHNIGIYDLNSGVEISLPGPLLGAINGATPVQGLTVRDLNVYFGLPQSIVYSADGLAARAYPNTDVTQGGYEAPLVCYGALATNGVGCSFHNVKVDGHLNLFYEQGDIIAAPGKEIYAGAIVGYLTGDCEFTNCHVGRRDISLYVAIDGVTDPTNLDVFTAVGGLLGQYEGTSLLMRGCSIETGAEKNESDMDLLGYERVGGIVGCAYGMGGSGCLIEDCLDAAYVSAVWRVVGGIAGCAVDTIIAECRVDRIFDYGGGASATSIVGIGVNGSHSILEYGDTGYWVCQGGVVGSARDSQVVRCRVGNCVLGRPFDVNGDVETPAYGQGGIVGSLESTAGGLYDASALNCVFDATMYLSEYWSYIGGIAGWAGGVKGSPAVIAYNISRAYISSTEYRGSSFGGIVGGAEGSFHVDYNRVCRPDDGGGSSYSVTFGDKIGGVVGEVRVRGDGTDGAMTISNNSIYIGAIISKEQDPDVGDELLKRAHRIVGYIPPEVELYADGASLLLRNNYSDSRTAIRADNTRYDDGSVYYEYELDRYTGDQGRMYGDYNGNNVAIADIEDCYTGQCVDPQDDPAYGANRANGENIPRLCQSEEKREDCDSCAAASLCGGSGQPPGTEPLAAVSASAAGFPCSCSDGMMNVVQGVIDSMAAMQDALNCYLNPGACGATGATFGRGFDCQLDYPLDSGDPVAWNEAIAPNLTRASSIGDSIQRGVCCVMNYVECCACATPIDPNKGRDVCLSAHSREGSDPRPGVSYTLTLAGSDPPVAYTRTAGEDGGMVFQDLPPGTYHVTNGGVGYPDFHTYDLVVLPSGSVSLIQTSPEDLPFRVFCY